MSTHAAEQYLLERQLNLQGRINNFLRTMEHLVTPARQAYKLIRNASNAYRELGNGYPDEPGYLRAVEVLMDAMDSIENVAKALITSTKRFDVKLDHRQSDTPDMTVVLPTADEITKWTTGDKPPVERMPNTETVPTSPEAKAPEQTEQITPKKQTYREYLDGDPLNAKEPARKMDLSWLEELRVRNANKDVRRKSGSWDDADSTDRKEDPHAGESTRD
jgi:hypothetical protein